MGEAAVATANSYAPSVTSPAGGVEERCDSPPPSEEVRIQRMAHSVTVRGSGSKAGLKGWLDGKCIAGQG